MRSLKRSQQKDDGVGGITSSKREGGERESMSLLRLRTSKVARAAGVEGVRGQLQQSPDGTPISQALQVTEGL